MDHQKLMTPADLRAWHVHMGYTYDTASKALGINRATYARLLSGEHAIDLRTDLACAALAAGLQPWAHGQDRQSINQTQA